MQDLIKVGNDHAARMHTGADRRTSREHEQHRHCPQPHHACVVEGAEGARGWIQADGKGRGATKGGRACAQRAARGGASVVLEVQAGHALLAPRPQGRPGRGAAAEQAQLTTARTGTRNASHCLLPFTVAPAPLSPLQRRRHLHHKRGEQFACPRGDTGPPCHLQ
jgi:hypothetical protein